MGELGSWIGFSFLGVNPIRHFLKISTSDSNINSNKNSKYENYMKESKQEFTKIKVQNAILMKHLREVKLVNQKSEQIIKEILDRINRSRPADSI